MTTRTRLWVLVVSTPIIAFALVGGYLGQAMTRDTTYRNLSIFGDVFELVVENYVEDVDVRKAMRGAMRGLAEGLDPDSAFLTPDLVKVVESNEAPAPADIGVELTRQYYLRIISARDGSPAAKAGLRTGDYLRAIDGRPTREMSPFEGARLLRGAPGSKVSLLVFRGNAAEPHEVALVRERSSGPDITSRMANPTTGYIRIAEFNAQSASRLKQAVDTLAKSGATRYVVDLRGTARGDLEDGVPAARLFVKSGTLTVRQTRNAVAKTEADKTRREAVAVQAGDGAVTAPVALLIDLGTAGAAEIFAAALDGNKRADLIGERTLGRVARQQLVKLSDGSGLLLPSTRYLTPGGQPITREKGLPPDVEVEQPDVEFGALAPTGDPTLDRAIEHISR
jgi:carboxyl-terminal processing protease